MVMAVTPSIISSLFLFLLLILVSFSSESAAKIIRSSPRLLGKFWHLNEPHKTLNLQQCKYETRYFQQQLDHFSFADLPTFRQRYLINLEHWLGPARKGPIFLYCGNEGDIEWFAANTGFVWEQAPQFGALVIFPEHRYYGESMPYGSREEAYMNSTTLSHLTAEQALADFAVLITDLKRNLSAEACPVVLFGGSYGGSKTPHPFSPIYIFTMCLLYCFLFLCVNGTVLAAWMRLKYPHIAIGALASSAPILQFEEIVPLGIFYDIVSNDFKRQSLSCFNTIKESWDVLTTEGQKNNGLIKLTKTFHLCQKLKSVEDLSDWLDSAYSYLAMTDYPYPTEFLMPLPGNPIKEVCKKIDSCPNGTSILERIFEGISVYYNYTGSVECFDLDDDPHGMNGWNWQACTEMVMPMSSNKESSMFPEYSFNYSAYEEECLKEFNVKPRPTWITTEFGGHDIKDVLRMFGSNIIFSNGQLDPWSGGSVLEDISETIVALVTEKGAHHIDLRAATAEDPEWLVRQRETEIKLIKGWLDDYYKENKTVFDM